MRLLRLALALLVAASGCGSPLLYAEIEEPRACITLHGQSFPGVPLGVSLQKALEFPLGSELPLVGEKDTASEIRLDEVTIIANASAAGDLDGIQEMAIKVVPPAGSSLPPETLITYQRAANPGSALVAGGATGVDLAPYLDGGAVHLEADVSGTLPGESWTADVKGCLYVKVTYDYGKGLGL
jgi:hypothetical protein